MSTLTYALVTGKREDASIGRGASTATQSNVATYVDTLAALVPAEVLALHAFIISFTTTKTDKGVQITSPGTLQGVFFALIVISMLLYWFGHRAQWDNWDWLRVGIPPLAFVGWTMLQQTTAFDAVVPNLAQAPRFAIAVIGAAVLGAAATALSYKADATPPDADMTSGREAAAGAGDRPPPAPPETIPVQSTTVLPTEPAQLPPTAKSSE